MESTAQTPLPGSSPDEIFPVLTAEQQARVLAHGRARRVASGETLIELNQQLTKIFVVVQGRLIGIDRSRLWRGRSDRLKSFTRYLSHQGFSHS